MSLRLSTKSRIVMSRSLSFRLGVSVTLGILVTSLLVTTGVVWRAVEREASERGLEIRATAQVLSASMSNAVAVRDRSAIHNSLRALRYSPRISFAEISTVDGKRLAQMGHQAALVQGEASVVWRARLTRLLQPKTIVETVDIQHRGQIVGQLKLGGEAPGARDALTEELTSNAWWAGIAILIGLLIAYRQQRKIIHPLRNLADVMETVHATGNLPDQVSIGAAGEVGVLVDSYNTMIDHITQRDQVIADHRDHLERKVDKRTRELRIARDQAEQAAEAKSRFLATMSHEIRTPMNGVLVMAELLARSDLKAEQKGYATVIARSGKALLDLLNDVLDISKHDADHMQLEEVTVSIDELVSDVVMLFWEQARSKGVILTSSVSANVQENFRCDPTRLRQCLANLIGNALKFTDSGYVAVDVGYNTDKVFVISVKDTGPGIPEDRQQAIFEAFEQVDSTTTRTHGGTGLGLAIVSRLVDAMGGQVSVKSRVGEGSCFTIRIPADGNISPRDTPQTSGSSIAVAESCHPAIRTRLIEALSAYGARVVEQVNRADCVIAPLGNLPEHLPECAMVAIWPFGTAEPFSLLESGAVADLLPMPYTRDDIRSLLERIQRNDYRGKTALDGVSSEADIVHEHFNHLRVLIVDDDEVNRQVLQDALAVFGVTPVVASEGATAITFARQEIFDLIVIDGFMPGMSGEETAGHIREIGTEEEKYPAILTLFTAAVPGELSDICDRDLFDHRLAKPFALTEMAALLNKCSGGAATENPEVAPVAEKHQPDAVLDETTLATLRALEAKRPGAMTRVLSKLLETLPDKLSDLYTSCKTQNAGDIRLASHSLRSTSGSAGAVQLAELAADLEMQAAEAERNALSLEVPPAMISEIEAAGTQTLCAVGDILRASGEAEIAT